MEQNKEMIDRDKKVQVITCPAAQRELVASEAPLPLLFLHGADGRFSSPAVFFSGVFAPSSSQSCSCFVASVNAELKVGAIPGY